MFLTILKGRNFGQGCCSKVHLSKFPPNSTKVKLSVMCTALGGLILEEQFLTKVSQVSGFLRVKTLHKVSIGSI